MEQKNSKHPANKSGFVAILKDISDTAKIKNYCYIKRISSMDFAAVRYLFCPSHVYPRLRNCCRRFDGNCLEEFLILVVQMKDRKLL